MTDRAKQRLLQQHGIEVERGEDGELYALDIATRHTDDGGIEVLCDWVDVTRMSKRDIKIWLGY